MHYLPILGKLNYHHHNPSWQNRISTEARITRRQIYGPKIHCGGVENLLRLYHFRGCCEIVLRLVVAGVHDACSWWYWH